VRERIPACGLGRAEATDPVGAGLTRDFSHGHADGLARLSCRSVTRAHPPEVSYVESWTTSTTSPRSALARTELRKCRAARSLQALPRCHEGHFIVGGSLDPGHQVIADAGSISALSAEEGAGARALGADVRCPLTSATAGAPPHPALRMSGLCPELRPRLGKSDPHQSAPSEPNVAYLSHI
jgi:hypothetical protein